MSKLPSKLLSLFTLVPGLLFGLAPGTVAAAEEEPPTVERHYAPRASGELLTPIGEYFLAGGGVTNYLDDTVRNRVDVGGAWDLRLGVGSRYFLGGEVAYVGSARNASGLGTKLVTNGAEGVLRLQYPYESGSWLLEPFAFGGIGWTHFNVNSAHVGQLDSDDVLEVPFGGGIMLAYNRLLFDARFTYRQTFNESLIRASDGTAASLKSWGVVGSVGYEF
jgi:hypothetical protein